MGVPGSIETRVSTPCELSAAIASRPKESSPTRPANTVGTPRTASQAAVLAAEPPWENLIGAGVSEPRASGAGSAAAMSSMTSPTHTTRPPGWINPAHPARR